MAARNCLRVSSCALYDSHAKNLSMLVDPTDQRPRLAPFYDLLNTRRYRHLSQKFAFKIGGENRPEWHGGTGGRDPVTR
ncbi:HipA domain-containing protein [Cupriavidus necator]|uniref:HipA domain-containing protein n=2 Tax=Cupriavidus TaxID=106589 RepID=UPI00059FAC73|nr:HipA domain-containing protein [Cupriavidus necator]QYY29512.1 HipA domain-containing protein [Cupriavidus pinatubonensis]